jgi:hypothetical protein
MCVLSSGQYVYVLTISRSVRLCVNYLALSMFMCVRPVRRADNLAAICEPIV